MRYRAEHVQRDEGWRRRANAAWCSCRRGLQVTRWRRTVAGPMTPKAPADLLIVRGDPTREIRALRDVVMVVQRGHIVRAP